MIQVFIRGQKIDSIDTEIALTLQNFKLDSMGSRKGSYSNVFELPKTNANKLIFENCEIITSLTNIPYQANLCKIFKDGILIIDGTAIIRETKQNYKIFISAGNSDFFKHIGSKKLKDVDLTEYDHEYNILQVNNLRESTEGFVYPNIDYGFFEFADITLDVQPLEFFHPSMWIKTIIEKAFEEFNYTLKGDLLESLTYKNCVVLCKGAELNLLDALAKYRFTIDFGQLLNVGSQKISFPTTGRVSDKLNLYKFDINSNQFVYTPIIPLASETNFEIGFIGKVITNDPRNQTNGVVNVDLLIYNEFGTVILTLTREVKFENRFFGIFNNYKAPSSGVLERDLNFTYPSSSADVAAFSNLLNSTSDLTTLRFGWNVRVDRGPKLLQSLSFENIEFEINQVPKIPGTRLNQAIKINVEASNVLPQSETVADLILTVANLEGIIFQVDEFTKTVNTARLDNIIRNKGKALNWSNKIDLSEEPEIFYTIENFAQSNIYKFAEDDKDVFLLDGFGEGSISVFNENIQTENVVFKSKFAPVPVVSTFIGLRTMGKVFTGDKYTFDGFNFILNNPSKIDQFTPRLAIISESEASLQIIENGNLINYEVNPLALNFDRSINNSYKMIRSVLQNTKVIKGLFLLDLEDINNLDFTVPVFVDYFGEFFYIESINQFKINKRESCFVTLIRI